MIALAGVIPDVDGLTILAGLESFQKWHHTFGHCLFTALILTTFAAIYSEKKLLVPSLVFLSVHIHILVDYFGAGGPDGSI